MTTETNKTVPQWAQAYRKAANERDDLQDQVDDLNAEIARLRKAITGLLGCAALNGDDHTDHEVRMIRQAQQALSGA